MIEPLCKSNTLFTQFVYLHLTLPANRVVEYKAEFEESKLRQVTKVHKISTYLKEHWSFQFP